MPMNEFEIFEHTADIGLRLVRPTLAELFRDAAFGMFQVMAPDNHFQPREQKLIVLRAGDLEELLVNWLSELNFYFQTEQFVPAEIDMQVEGKMLRAEVRGEFFDPAVHVVEIEIKAVTFYKIAVKREQAGWRAQVIFDI